MHPTLFQIGSFKVASFGVMMVIAFIVSLTIARKRAPRFGMTAEQVSDVSFWTIIGGILGARLFFIVQDSSYWKNPSQLLTIQFQGLTSFGGFIIGGLLGAYMCKRRKLPVLGYLDSVAPAFLVGHAIGRIGCLFNGCCHGARNDHAFPFSVYSSEAKCLTAPAQLYDSLLNLIAFGIVMYISRNNQKAGFAFGMAFFVHGITRFIYEFFRAGASSTSSLGIGLTDGHIMAALVAAAGLFVALRPVKTVSVSEAVS
jgi:phosphatidylglycerol---prolipoprotein diacylglyceryl transferase